MRSNLGDEPPYDWGDFEDGDETLVKSGQLFIAGIASFLITVVVYSAIAYYVISVLNDSGIISGTIEWTALCLSISALNFMRVWDRAFFKRR